MKLFYCTLAVLLFTVGLRFWQYTDERALNDVWITLVSSVEKAPPAFDPAMIADLPEPARRFFESTIEPATPLFTAAEITMTGEFSLGTEDDPAYQLMQACQLLVPPEGFIWQVRLGQGLMHFVGSDVAYPAVSWTRFWLSSLVPVARVGNTSDHALSSFGRYMAEAVFWTPAALLPSPGVRWEPLGENVSRVTVTRGDLTQSFDIVVDENGHPAEIVFQRWSNANESQTFQRQPFGGYLSDFKEFEGFWLPTKVIAGNHFGTDNYFPFFKATIASIEFIKSPDQMRRCQSPW